MGTESRLPVPDPAFNHGSLLCIELIHEYRPEASIVRVPTLCLVAILLLSTTLDTNAAPTTNLQWQQYQLRYPANWLITRDKQQEEVRFIEFTPSTHWPVRLLLTLFGKVPEPDQNYRAKPAMAGLSICLPMALQLAGDAKGKAISTSLGSIELSTGPQPTTRLRVLLPGGNNAVHLECFLYAQQGAAFSGIIRTDTKLGGLIDDQAYLDLAPELFSTIRGIRIQP